MFREMDPEFQIVQNMAQYNRKYPTLVVVQHWINEILTSMFGVQ